MSPLDQPLRLRVGGLADHHLRPRVPRNAWQSPVSSGRPARHRPIAPSPSQTSTRGTAPSAADQLPPAREQVLCPPGRDQQRHQPAGVRAHHGQHRQLRRLAHQPAARREVTGGNQKSHWAISPAAYAVRDAGSGGRYAGRSSATRSRSTRTEYGHPIRSAITVAGIVGYASAAPGSAARAASVTDPFGGRSYFGGRSLAERRPHRVPRDPHHPGDHLDRHLLRPVQPADLSPVLHGKHPFHPLARLEPESSGRGSKFRCHAGVSIHVPPTSNDGATVYLSPVSSPWMRRTSARVIPRHLQQ